MITSFNMRPRFLCTALLLWGGLTCAQEPAIVVLGDSLSAAYGMDVDQSWVQRLRERLQRGGYPHQVVNASVSGDTTRGALARLDALLQAQHPAILIIELGGNDGLRGLSLEEIKQNLARMIEMSRQHGAQVLLVSMRLPPNYGAAYIQRFQSMYRELAAADGARTAPFILQGIAERPELMQADGIHPRAEAQAMMLENIWPSLVPLL